MSSPSSLSFVVIAMLVCLFVRHGEGQYRRFDEVCPTHRHLAWPHLSYDANTPAVTRVRDGLGLQLNILRTPVMVSSNHLKSRILELM